MLAAISQANVHCSSMGVFRGLTIDNCIGVKLICYGVILRRYSSDCNCMSVLPPSIPPFFRPRDCASLYRWSASHQRSILLQRLKESFSNPVSPRFPSRWRDILLRWNKSWDVWRMTIDRALYCNPCRDAVVWQLWTSCSHLAGADLKFCEMYFICRNCRELTSKARAGCWNYVIFSS